MSSSDDLLVRGQRQLGAVSADRDICPEAAGLHAIAHGFALVHGDDDEKIRLETPMYDALYAWCAKQVESS